jgi:hypothetical protein
MQDGLLSNSSKMAIRAGCPMALLMAASLNCLSLKESVLVAPILFIDILQYYDKD